jgi:hypothetical protein
MDDEAGKRKRGRTLELKGEGQGFTLRGHTIVLKKPITRAINLFNVPEAGGGDCSTHRSCEELAKL